MACEGAAELKDLLVRLNAADASAQLEGVRMLTACSWGDATTNYPITGVSTEWVAPLFNSRETRGWEPIRGHSGEFTRSGRVTETQPHHRRDSEGPGLRICGTLADRLSCTSQV